MEKVEEVIEEEILINVCLDVVWQLVHETLIFFGLNSIVLVILPVVFKVDFESLCHFFR